MVFFLQIDQDMESNSLTSELLAAMRQAGQKALSNVRDREAMKRACDRMDRMREEIRKKHGTLDIGVPAIRELRDE